MKKIISVILSTVMLLAFLPFSAAAEEWIRVEDTDARIEYTGGSWNPWSGDGNDSGSNVMVTDDTVGQSASLTFEGTAVRYVSRKHPLLGVAEIFIDDVSQGDYDLYSTGWGDYQKVIFEKTDLSPQKHTIRVVLKGAHEGDTNGSRLMLDYFAYLPVLPEVDVTLASLCIDGYSLVPEFSPEVNAYLTEVDGTTETVRVFAEATDSDNAEVYIEGETVLPEGNELEIKPGTNRFTIEIKPKSGGTSGVYTLLVKRPVEISLSEVLLSGEWKMTPDFAPNTYEYEISGDYNDSMVLTPKAASDELIVTVDGAEQLRDGAATIPLNDGVNPVSVSVRAKADPVKAENLIAKWNFENNTTDDGPNALPTQQIGTVEYEAGKTGLAARFDGSSYLTVNDQAVLNPDEQITLMAWIKPNSVTEGQDIIFKDQSYRARIDISLGAGAVQGAMALLDGDGNLSWYTNNAHVQSQPGTATAGCWQHLAVTYDGRDVRVYLDGILVANTSNPSRRTLNKTSNTVLIGQDFRGLMDDLRIYDTALSAEEIAQVVKDEEPKVTYQFNVNNDIKNLPVDAAIEEISNATAQTLNLVLTGEYERVYRLLGLSVEEALALENQSAFFDLFAALKPYESGDDLKEKFNDSLLVNRFNTANDKEREEILRSEEMGLSIDEENLAQVLKAMQSKVWESKSELTQAYYVLNYQAGIQTLTSYQQFRGLVERTAKALEITITKADEDVLAQAYKNMYQKVTASYEDYADFTVLIRELNSEISRLDNQGGSSGGSSSGRPSGGSSGSSSGGNGGSYGVSSDAISSGGQESSFSLTYPPVLREPVKFSDVEEAHWAKSAIDDLYCRNVLSAYEDGTFHPNQSVTRAEFSKMAVLMFGFSTDNNECSFADVSKENWAYPYVASLCAEGIVQGVSEELFGAQEAITRQDMAVILYRVAQKKQVSLDRREDCAFKDSEVISDYAKAAVETLCKAGVITGMDDGSFSPQMPVTRAQAAVMLKRFMEAGGAK